jgi:hypothetical protein
MNVETFEVAKEYKMQIDDLTAVIEDIKNATGISVSADGECTASFSHPKLEKWKKMLIKGVKEELDIVIDKFEKL